MWGTSVSNVPSAFLKNGRMKAIYTEESIPDQWWLPVGYYSGWMLPRTAWYIAWVNALQWANITQGTAVHGVNWQVLLQWLWDTVASLSLIVSMAWVLAGTSVVSASVAWVIFWSGSASGIGTLTALLWALAGILWQANGIWTANTTQRADGYMTGNISPFTELSPQWLANAVWSALASEYNTSGTMGAKLNTASSGWVDLNALAQAVWEYTIRELTTSGWLSPTQAQQLADTIKTSDTLLNTWKIILPLR